MVAQTFGIGTQKEQIEEKEFGASLIYLASSRLTWSIVRTLARFFLNLLIHYNKKPKTGSVDQY